MSPNMGGEEDVKIFAANLTAIVFEKGLTLILILSISSMSSWKITLK